MTQAELFREPGLRLPKSAPLIGELQPSASLLGVFEECHNHIYANDGFLKDRIFHEFVKLLMAKLFDERKASAAPAAFYVLDAEYEASRAGEPSGLQARILGLLSEAHGVLGAALGDDVTLRLSESSLAFVVARLQWISLSASPADAKGEAFQTFVYRHQRGDRGEFFTPQPVVRLAVEILDPQPDDVVLDPASGSAGFLIEAMRWVLRNYPQTNRGEYVRQRLRGLEFNPEVARAASMRLLSEGGTGDEIRATDTLTADVGAVGGADLVLTNPPFGSKGRIEARKTLEHYDLGHRWIRTATRWVKTDELQASQTPEILFIERSVQCLAPAGRMAIVVPDGLLQNSSLGYVRAWIREQCELLGVVSVPNETFVPYGTGIKTSVLFLRRRPSPTSERVFMARVRNIGYDVKGKPTSGSDVVNVIGACRDVLQGKEQGAAAEISLDPKDIGDRLDVEYYLESDRLLLEELMAVGARPLGDLAHIVRKRDAFRRSEDEVRYVAIADIDTRLLAIVSQEVLAPKDAPSRATYRLREGDIITATSGASTGTSKQATALVAAVDDGVICSNGLAVIRDVKVVHPYFLAAFMKTDAFLRQVRRLMTGHAIPAISLEDLSRVLVPIPTPELQDKTVKQVTELLELRESAIRLGGSLGAEIDRQLSTASNHSSSVA